MNTTDAANRTPEQIAGWARCAYEYLLWEEDCPPEDAAALYEVPVEAIQSVCSGNGGHEWTRWEAGDGVWYQCSGPFCGVCGAVDEGEPL